MGVVSYITCGSLGPFPKRFYTEPGEGLHFYTLIRQGVSPELKIATPVYTKMTFFVMLQICVVVKENQAGLEN